MKKPLLIIGADHETRQAFIESYLQSRNLRYPCVEADHVNAPSLECYSSSSDFAACLVLLKDISDNKTILKTVGNNPSYQLVPVFLLALPGTGLPIQIPWLRYSEWVEFASLEALTAEHFAFWLPYKIYQAEQWMAVLNENHTQSLLLSPPVQYMIAKSDKNGIDYTVQPVETRAILHSRIYLSEALYTPQYTPQLLTRVAEMTSLAFELHAHLIYEQGGYIQHFGNDDLVACFDCHKDEDAQEKLNQAWKCAQEIQASIEKEADLDGLQVGIGISVGEVTSKITSGHHCGYLMVGNAVKEAAHLSQQAGAGGIMVNTPCATSSPSEE